jgi:hypothetical protein
LHKFSDHVFYWSERVSFVLSFDCDINKMSLKADSLRHHSTPRKHFGERCRRLHDLSEFSLWLVSGVVKRTEYMAETSSRQPIVRLVCAIAQLKRR